MIDLKTAFLVGVMNLHWLNEYVDVMYLVKKNKPFGKVKSGWFDNGEWYE